MYVAVVGPGAEATADDITNARTVGRLLAERGAVVLTGGLDRGVMHAAHQGAASAGGTSVALLPGGDRAHASSYATVAIATGLGQLRNALLVRSADAVIAIGGSWGTLSEVALAMRTGKAVVGLGGWSVHDANGVPVQLTQADSAEHAVSAVLDG